MNEIVNSFVLAGDKFMSELHFNQTVFTSSAWGTFTKYRERIQKFKETGELNYVHKRNELDKACFAHDVAYAGS